MVCRKIPCKKALLAKNATIDAQFYFAHLYASWERGLNENTNGLIRQYLKKGSDFSKVTEDEILIILDKLNNRPRKSLNYATPNEIFLKHHVKQPQNSQF